MGQELTDRQAQLAPTGAPGQRAIWVKECRGEPGRPYCKTLVLSGARVNDTGYFRCYYRDIKAIIDGTTAVSVYVFVSGKSSSYRRGFTDCSEFMCLRVSRKQCRKWRRPELNLGPLR